MADGGRKRNGRARAAGNPRTRRGQRNAELGRTRAKANKERAAALGAQSATAVRDNPAIRSADLTDTERARLELRKVQRKLSKNEANVTLPTLPGVQPFSAMTRFIEGGRDAVIDIIQMAVLNNDPAAVAWWEVYRELPSYPRSIVSFDDVCAASGVTPQQLIITLVTTAMNWGRDVGNLVQAITAPKVVTKLVESAQRIDGPHAEIGLKDRHAFLQAQGTLLAPRSATINVHASANAQAASVAEKEPSVPSFTETIKATAVPTRAAIAAPERRPLADIETTATTETATEPAHVRSNDHGA